MPRAAAILPGASTRTNEGKDIEVMLTYLMIASDAATGGENFV
jgi:hypothetical protein